MKRFGLLLLVALVCGWQASLWRAAAFLDPQYTVGASVGVCGDLRNFFLFAYHFGEFPVGSPLAYGRSREQLEALVRDRGDTLVQDFNQDCNTRFGDWGKVLLFWPNAWWTGSPAAASAGLANRLLFIAALSLFLMAFWRVGCPAVAVLLVVLIGSNPFQLHEAYASDNVFSWPISITLLVAAVNAGVISGETRRAPLVAVATGLIVGCAREVRSEAALVGLAVPLIYATRAAPWRRKAALVALFALSVVATDQLWRAAFARSFRSAQAFVARAGGHPYPGMWAVHHPFWHAVYAGMADFSYGKKGYAGYDDTAAYRYAHPILRERYGLDFTYADGKYYFAESHDAAGRYRVSPLDLPEYAAVIRAKVLRDIWSDPRWYLQGLTTRAAKILRHTTPLSVAAGARRVAVPLSGWILVPTVLAVLIARRRDLLSLILFSIPPSLTALLIYSDFGTTNYTIFHLVSVAVWGQLLVEAYARARVRNHIRVAAWKYAEFPKWLVKSGGSRPA